MRPSAAIMAIAETAISTLSSAFDFLCLAAGLTCVSGCALASASTSALASAPGTASAPTYELAGVSPAGLLRLLLRDSRQFMLIYLSLGTLGLSAPPAHSRPSQLFYYASYARFRKAVLATISSTKPAPKMATAIQAACCTSAPVCGWSGVVGGVCVLVISVESPSTSEMVV